MLRIKKALHTNELGNIGHQRRRQRHPASQVNVTLGVTRMRRARKIVEAGSQRLRVQLVDGTAVATSPPNGKIDKLVERPIV